MATEEQEPPNLRNWRFRLIILSICSSILLCGLDLTAVSTALPTIIEDLHGQDSFAWVSAAYTLAATTVLPLSGRLSDIFGRRDILLGFLVMFTIGSAVTASARSMNILIVGRTFQGVGSGGIQSLAAIVIGDLVSLRERGLYNGFIAAAYTLASLIGPFLGGLIAQKTSWRWIFYINLPLCAISIACVSMFLRLKKPTVPSVMTALGALDWTGNVLIIGSTTSCIVSLTWAGVAYPWSSYRVIIPLVIGICGLIAAVVYEGYFCKNPIIPVRLLMNRTSVSAYLQTFIHQFIVIAIPFYGPIYLQGALAETPIKAGLAMLSLSVLISPCAIVQGVIVAKTGRYRLIHLGAWTGTILGLGLLLYLKSTSSIGVWCAFMPILAISFGLLYCTTFSALADLPPTENASAIAFLTFMRNFPQSWSIAVGATIMQTGLRHRLPQAFLSQFKPGQDITESAIPSIPHLPGALQAEVRKAFADSLHILWLFLLGCAVIGCLAAFAMRELPLHTQRDRKWGMQERKGTEATQQGANPEPKDEVVDDLPVVESLTQGAEMTEVV